MSNQNWLQRLFGRKPDQQKISQPATISEAETQRIAAEVWHIIEQTSETIDQESISDERVQAIMANPASEEALAAVPALWQIGDVILNQYEVIDKLGEGGMGTVYKVRHHGWDIDLAVKSPRPETFAAEQGKINFTHEAETWVNLQLHPHIVACYYVRILGGIPRVFAEYVADGNLADWIRGRRLYQGGHEQTLERMLDAAIQFAWGLHAAHEQGLIHQDIKPANVMLTPEGIVKVTDFGLARARSLAGEPLSQHASGSQSVLVSARGMTPAYCSPEQAKGEALSRRTDIWSWGVSVLEMFMGGVTWYSGTVARDVLASYDTPDDAAIPPMPKAVMLLLARCFEQLPENRPTTMLAVAAELQVIYADEVGKPYPRKMPQMAEMLADSLNNRALSLSNMGKLVESQQLWEQALQADPRHLETTYNRGVLLWREGKLSDDALVKQLEVVRNAHDPRWQASYLLAQVHLERGDRNTALPLLEEAAKQAPTALEVQQLYRKVRAEKITDKRDPLKLEGHNSVIYAADISADGHVAISSEANSVRIWDVDTGRCLHVLREKEIWPTIKVVGLSADGRLAISAQGKKIWFWDVRTGQRLRTLQQRDEVRKASLSASGELIISGDGNSAHIWDARTGRTLHTLQHPHEVQAVGLSADGRLAVTSSGFLPPRGVKGKENTLQLWDMGTGRCVLTLEQAGGGVDAVSLSADKRLLAANIAGAIHVWETSTGRSLHVLKAHTHSAHSLRLSADGHWLVSGSPDRTVRLWDLKAGRCVYTQHYSEWIWGVSISADGRRIISGGGDTVVRVCELDQQRMLCPLHPSQVFSHTDVTQAKSQAQRLLEQFEQAYAEKRFAATLTLLRDLRSLPGWERKPESLQAWAKLTPHCVRAGFRAAWLVQSFQVVARSMKLSADGQWAVFAGKAGVEVWEMSTGRNLRSLQGHTGEINAVCLSADERWVVSGSSDLTVRVWDINSGDCLHVLQGHTDHVMTVDMSADGKLIVSSGHDGYIRIWEAKTGRCLHTLDAAPNERGVRRWVYGVSISADGRWLLSGGQDGSMRIWEANTGRCLHVLKEHNGVVTSVNISADGQFAISGSNDDTIRVWEVRTGRCLRVVQANLGLQHGVNISPDGRWIVSGSAHQLVQLWEASSGRCLCTLQDHTAWVHSVCLSADGNWLLSAAYDGTMRLWALDWELEARSL